jgi:hypothetical protein
MMVAGASSQDHPRTLHTPVAISDIVLEPLHPTVIAHEIKQTLPNIRSGSVHQAVPVYRIGSEKDGEKL